MKLVKKTVVAFLIAVMASTFAQTVAAKLGFSSALQFGFGLLATMASFRLIFGHWFIFRLR